MHECVVESNARGHRVAGLGGDFAVIQYVCILSVIDLCGYTIVVMWFAVICRCTIVCNVSDSSCANHTAPDAAIHKSRQLNLSGSVLWRYSPTIVVE